MKLSEGAAMNHKDLIARLRRLYISDALHEWSFEQGRT
jgi:hypothetical protein